MCENQVLLMNMLTQLDYLTKMEPVTQSQASSRASADQNVYRSCWQGCMALMSELILDADGCMSRMWDTCPLQKYWPPKPHNTSYGIKNLLWNKKQNMTRKARRRILWYSEVHLESENDVILLLSTIFRLEADAYQWQQSPCLLTMALIQFWMFMIIMSLDIQLLEVLS